MSYIRAFIPWIVYAAVSSVGWGWAALAALLVSLVEIGRYLREGRSPDSLMLEMGAAVFFAVITATAFANPHAWVHEHHYETAAAYAALAIIAWGSVAIRKPFTLGLAKLDVPREFWDNPLFLRANMIISLIWALSFTLVAALLASVAALGRTSPAASVAGPILGFVVPMAFTLWYRSRILARRAAAETPMRENA